MYNQVQEGQSSINDMVGALKSSGQVQQPPDGVFRDVQWLKNNIENEDAVLEFLDNPNNMLEDQPTDILIELA